METTKAENMTKLAKDIKGHPEVKKKKVASIAEWNWKPLATDLAITLTKACITAFAFKVSGQLYDYSFSRKPSNGQLALLDGGKKTSVA